MLGRILTLLLLLATSAFAIEPVDDSAIVRHIDDLVSQISTAQESKKAGDPALRELQTQLVSELAVAKQRHNQILDGLTNKLPAAELARLEERDAVIYGAIRKATRYLPPIEATDEAVTRAGSLNAMLTRLDDQPDCCCGNCAKKVLSNELVDVEAQLRKQGADNRQKIAKLDDAIKVMTELGGSSKELADKREVLKKQQAEIATFVPIPDNSLLYRIFEDDQSAWVNQFYAGLEFDDLNGLFSTGFARIGYDTTLHFGSFPPESHPKSGFSFCENGWFFNFNAGVTTTAESSLQKLGTNATCQDKNHNTIACTARALEGELKAFWPLYRSVRSDRLRHYFGPVVDFGVRHTTDQNLQMPHAQYRYYGGLHLGFGRDAFSELLVGKTSGLRTRRIELRGQVPVAVWGNGNRLFLGAIDNIRFSRDPKRFDASGNAIEENDVFRIYVVYEVDFLKIFGITPPK